MADTDISANEMLEEMLKKGEIELFPKLEKAADRFIDIFNHTRVQTRIQHELNKFIEELAVDSLLARIKNSNTVYDIMRNIKHLIDVLKSKVDSTQIFESLYRNGFHALLSDDRFKFLNDDTIDEDARVEKFLDILNTSTNEDTHENTGEAFESYIATWKKTRLKWGWSEAQVREEESKLRNEFKQAAKDNNDFAQKIISDLEKQFEPLREKLRGVNSYGIVGTLVLVSIGVTGDISQKYSRMTRYERDLADVIKPLIQKWHQIANSISGGKYLTDLTQKMFELVNSSLKKKLRSRISMTFVT